MNSDSSVINRIAKDFLVRIAKGLPRPTLVISFHERGETDITDSFGRSTNHDLASRDSAKIMSLPAGMVPPNDSWGPVRAKPCHSCTSEPIREPR